MKTAIYLIFISLLLTGCAKDKPDEPADKEDEPTVSDLEPLAEKDLTISKGKIFYTDESSNQYHTVVFDQDHKSHIYKLELQQGKDYMISMIGPYSYYSVEMFLLVSSKDTLFHGYGSMGPPPRKFIYFTPTYTGTYYITTNYLDYINNAEEYRLVIEELKTSDITYNDLNMVCCGDWFINRDGYLALALHETGITKWARINKSSSIYQFSYDVTQTSGNPDNYIGIMCCASNSQSDVRGLPSCGYVFDVKAPAEWRKSVHIQGGTGYDYGYLNENIPTGQEHWHNIGVQTIGDSISFSAMGDEMAYFRNIYFLDNGLYIVVEDVKQDTVIFKNVNLSF